MIKQKKVANLFAREVKQKMEQKKKFEIENKARFWVGIGLIVPEFLVLIIYSFGFVDWCIFLYYNADYLMYCDLGGLLGVCPPALIRGFDDAF